MSALLALALVASGLHGVVTRGPITPVCRVGQPCSEPAVGAVLVFSHDGRIAARARAGAGGRYTVRLLPGYYAVRVSPPQRIGGLKPREVRVRPGVNGRVDFQIDTGIR
ncbi:MAG: hypothetical protein ACXVRJ_13070 [Gaiellaceae bacterium]